MKYFQTIMILYTLAKIKETEMVTLSNKKISITFHDYDRHWNEAKAICEAQGGQLYAEDSTERAIVLEQYRSNSVWDTNKEVWIGLHYPNVGTDDTYAWTNCFWLTSQFNRYKSSEPNDASDRRCILSLESGWKTEHCENKKRFLCETLAAGDCIFSTTTGIPTEASDFTAVSINTADESTCETKCLTTIYSNTNCWGLNFNSAASDNCVLYFTTDPFYFSSSATYDASTVRMSIKICYTDNLDTTDDTTVVSDKNDIPTGCSSYKEQNTTSIEIIITTETPTTTTTASSPTSTTLTAAPTTTTTTTEPTTTTTTNAPTSTTTTSVPTTTTTTPALTTTTTTAAPTTTTTTAAHTTTTTTAAATTTTTTAAPATTTTTAAHTTTTTALPTTTSVCTCKCLNLSKLFGNYTPDSNWANMTTEEKVEHLVSKLRVDKTKLSSFARRKTSAPDDRVASKSVGYLAILFISLIFGLLIVSDMINFLKYLTRKSEHREDRVSKPPEDSSSL